MDDYFMDPRMQNMQPMGMQPMGMQPMGMQPMGMYDDQNRMMVSPEQQLERMYPRVYYIVNPVVIRHCDMFDNTHGPSYCPTKEEAEQMIDNVLMEVEAPVKAEFEAEEYEKDNNSGAMPVINTLGNPHGRRNPFLRGLVGTLLIGELLGRRRRHGFRRFPGQFSPFFFPGFFPFFPGFF